MKDPLVVLLEVHAPRISVREFEGQAPRAIYMDSVADWRKAFECMEVEAGQVHIFGLGRNVETVEPDQDTAMHPSIDCPGASFGPEVRQRLALKAPDQIDFVSK
jgi:hypothetical protein